MTLEEKVNDQLISLGQQADAIVRLQRERDELRAALAVCHEQMGGLEQRLVRARADVARLRDNLHTIATHNFANEEECANYANTCWRASTILSSSGGLK